MLRIKTIIYILFVLIALEGIGSCTKENNMSPPIHYSNRVAQDFTYRKGKWYSISDGAGYGFTVSPLLDTIWFVSDSIAGWTHSVPTDLHAYSFRKTYLKDFYHLKLRLLLLNFF